MAYINPSDVHVDKRLTNYAARYGNELSSFIAGKVLPVIKVNNESDKILIYDRANMRSPIGSQRAAGAEAMEVRTFDLSDKTYNLIEHAMKTLVPDRERSNADAPLRPDEDAVEFITEALHVEREIEVAELVFTSTTYAAAQTISLTANGYWDTSTGSPIANTDAAIVKIESEIGKTPNLMVIGKRSFLDCRDHGDFMDAIKYTQTGITTPDLMGAVLGIDKVMVGNSAYQSTGEGESSETTAYLWGQNALICYSGNGSSVKNAGFGALFTGNIGGQTCEIRKYREESRRGDMIEGAWMYDPFIVSTISAFFIRATTAN